MKKGTFVKIVGDDVRRLKTTLIKQHAPYERSAKTKHKKLEPPHVVSCNIWILTLLFALNAMAATNDLTGLIQKALFEEEGNHNLPAAIEAYQSIITKSDDMRGITATALFRLGECYRKQGKTNEAVVQYQRLLREFSDQTTLATLSEQNLGALGTPVTARPDKPAYDNAAWQKKVAEIKKMPKEEQRVAVQQLVPNRVLDTLMEKLLTEQQALATAKVGFGTNHPEVQKKEAIIATIENQIDTQVDLTLRRFETGSDFAQFLARLDNPQAGSQTNATKDTSEDAEIKRIQRMMKDSPDLINAKDSGGTTPLHLAVSRGQIKVAQFLLSNGADIDARTVSGETPLHFAVSNGNKGITELLLSKNANVNAADRSATTPLQIAAQKGFRSIAELLIANGADLNAKSLPGESPLHLAVINGFRAVAELLISSHADINIQGYVSTVGYSLDGTPLHVAVARGDEPMVKLLLSGKANVDATNRNGQTPLDNAAAFGDIRMTKFLLENGADPNFKNPVRNPSVGAQTGQPVSVVTPPASVTTFSDRLRLLNNLSSPWEEGWAPLHYAVSAKQTGTMKLLLEKGADPNAQVPIFHSPGSSWNHVGYTPLLIATFQGDAPAVELLSAYKADPNARGGEPTDQGPQRLHRTLRLPGLPPGSAQTYLNSAESSDTAAESPDGDTPLLNLVASVRSRDPDKIRAVKVLLDGGADPNGANANNHTALMLAASEGEKEVVKLLIDDKANLNAQITSAVNKGNTALNEITKSGKESPFPSQVEKNPNWREIAEMLLAAGADPNLPNASGTTPLGNINTSTDPFWMSIADALRKHGAVVDVPDFTSIRLTRKTGKTIAVFRQSTNDINHFTLFETLATYYASPYTFGPQDFGPGNVMVPGGAFAFPDLTNLKLLRPHKGTRNAQEEIPLRLLNGSNTFDCSKDMHLEFGDMIEIPEREHGLTERGVGLTNEQMESLRNCLARKITVKAKGGTVELTGAAIGVWNSLRETMKQPEVQNLLTSASDLTRVTVNRSNVNGKPAKIVEDVQSFWDGKRQWADDLWLLPGDVIEVPDR